MRVFERRRKQEMQERYRMYVGNIEYSVGEEELLRFLDEKGVKVNNLRIIKDRVTGRSKGFGFADMSSEEELNSAIEILNGQELKGRKLKVDRARDKKNIRRRFRRPYRP